MIKEIEAYQRHKNLKLAANELGIKWQSLYCKLRKAGVAVVGDKELYGSYKDKLAFKAETLFNKLVPDAKNQNELKFQSKVDFMVGNHKIDVKSSTLKKGAKRFNTRRWAFSIKKQEFIADFLVCFAFNDDESYKILVIPGEFIRFYSSISISETGNSKWLEFEVSQDDINSFFSEVIKIGIENRAA